MRETDLDWCCTQRTPAKNGKGNSSETTVLSSSRASLARRDRTMGGKERKRTSTISVKRNWLPTQNGNPPACAVPELCGCDGTSHSMEWTRRGESRHTLHGVHNHHAAVPRGVGAMSVDCSAIAAAFAGNYLRINYRFLKNRRKQWPGDIEMRREMSLIEEGDNPHPHGLPRHPLGQFLGQNGGCRFCTRSCSKKRIVQHSANCGREKFNTKPTV